MLCVGSIPSAMNFFLCDTGSKVLDLSIGEGRASVFTVTKSARINAHENMYLVWCW